MHLTERLTIYGYLSNKDILTKIMLINRNDRYHIIDSSALLRKGRHVMLKIPKFEKIKEERETYYQKT